MTRGNPRLPTRAPVHQGISGAKGRDQRPAFDKLCKDATRRHFDVVLAWSIDRTGRSVHGVSGFIMEMSELGVAQYYHQQAIDTATPAGKAMVQMCGVFAELERDMIRERINPGLARARANGVKLGRPKVERRVRRELAKGTGIVKVAKMVGVGNGTVARIKGRTQDCIRQPVARGDHQEPIEEAVAQERPGTATGKLLLTVIGAIGQFEREMMLEPLRGDRQSEGGG